MTERIDRAGCKWMFFIQETGDEVKIADYLGDLDPEQSKKVADKLNTGTLKLRDSNSNKKKSGVTV